MSPGESLIEFYTKYNPTICAHKHTCVGLGMEVINNLKVLENEFPGITESMMLVSCDESIQDVPGYTAPHPGPQGFLIKTAKDHVMMAIHIRIEDRPGVFLSDLGYHISRVVTVMEDRNYPHTGWFTQYDKPHCRKEHYNQLNEINSNYIEWHERDIRGDKVKERISLVYIAQEYLSAVTVTEKRNLVWDLRALLARDSKGCLAAGIYFSIKKEDQLFTILFDNHNGNQRKKLKFNIFLELEKLPQEVVEEIEMCNEQLHQEDGELLSILHKLATIMADKDFIKEFLQINTEINQFSAVP